MTLLESVNNVVQRIFERVKGIMSAIDDLKVAIEKNRQSVNVLVTVVQAQNGQIQSLIKKVEESAANVATLQQQVDDAVAAGNNESEVASAVSALTAVNSDVEAAVAAVQSTPVVPVPAA